MTDQEFELLDELYFVISYQELKKNLAWDSNVLESNIKALVQKSWIKIMRNQDVEIEDKLALELTNFEACYFLATKEGLMKHNTN